MHCHLTSWPRPSLNTCAIFFAVIFKQTFTTLALAAMGAGLLIAGPATAADLSPAPVIDVPLGQSSEGDTAVDSSGRVYVASKLSSPNGKIFVFTSAGVNTGVAITGLAAPDGIAVDASGDNVYAAEDGGSKVSYHYRFGGSFTAGATITGLSRPVGVATAPDGTLYVALFGGNEVRQYTVTGSGAGRSFTLAKTFTGFNGPYGITVDSSGTMYVSEIFQNRVKAFTAATISACGATCAIAADRTISGGATQLAGAVFLDTDSAGRLYVASYQNTSIAVFASTANGNMAPLDRINGETTPACTVSATKLCSPWGMAVDSSGAIYTQNANVTIPYRWLKFAAIYAQSASAGRTAQTPADILQQVPMPATGTCAEVTDEAFSYGTGLSGGWSKAWGEWANLGTGAWVCSRTLTYSEARGAWTVSGS